MNLDQLNAIHQEIFNFSGSIFSLSTINEIEELLQKILTKKFKGINNAILWSTVQKQQFQYCLESSDIKSSLAFRKSLKDIVDFSSIYRTNKSVFLQHHYKEESLKNSSPTYELICFALRNKELTISGIACLVINENEKEALKEQLPLIKLLCNLSLIAATSIYKQELSYPRKLNNFIKNHAFNKSVVEYGSDIIFIVDKKGRLLYNNPSSEETLGYQPGYLKGKSMLDFVHIGDRKSFHREFKLSLEKPKANKFAYRFLCADGVYKYLESNSINLLDKEGIEGLILDCRDITDKIHNDKLLLDQKDFIQSVIDTDPNLIIVKRFDDNKFELINAAAANLFGVKKEDAFDALQSKSISVPTKLYFESEKEKESLEKGEEITYEERFVNENEEEFWFQTTKKLIPKEDKRHQILCISVNITQRKKDAEALVRAQKDKELFLANISHEIRTPINGITGLSTLLIDTNIDKQQEKYLNSIISSAKNLKVIINDILDLSKLESGKLQFEKIPFKIIDQIKSVISTFEYQCIEKGLQLSYELDDSLDQIFVGDPVRLNQLFNNLLSNAIKFTNKGKVEIFVKKIKTTEHFCEMKFTVSDTGIGIPKDKIASIFESFKQADESISRKFGGTGLGLAICKQIVELQGGKIWVVSEENKGTSFEFELSYPIAGKDIVETFNKEFKKDKIIHKIDLDQLRVLLVEDNSINQLYAGSFLTKWNCSTTIANNGKEAIEQYMAKDFDIILMDIQMPILDGFGATIEMRKLPKDNTKKVPIIAMTAASFEDIQSKCNECGITDIVSKPFNPTELHHIITKYCDIQTKTEEVSSTEEDDKSEKTEKEFKSKKHDHSKDQKIIDLSYLKEMSGGNDVFVNEMISLFIENSVDILSKMKQANLNQNYEKIGELSHKLKPSITFMGIHTIKDTVIALEKLKKDPTFLTEKQINSNIEALDIACRNAQVLLKDLIA